MVDDDKRDWREIARELARATDRDKIRLLLEELNEAWMNAHPDSTQQITSQPPLKRSS
jgi:hypothetical protein